MKEFSLIEGLNAAGLNLPEPSGGLLFEDLSMLIRSAADGNGVALVRLWSRRSTLYDSRLEVCLESVLHTRTLRQLIRP